MLNNLPQFIHVEVVQLSCKLRYPGFSTDLINSLCKERVCYPITIAILTLAILVQSV